MTIRFILIKFTKNEKNYVKAKNVIKVIKLFFVKELSKQDKL